MVEVTKIYQCPKCKKINVKKEGCMWKPQKCSQCNQLLTLEDTIGNNAISGIQSLFKKIFNKD